jgi:hypothetical protein
MEYIYKNDVGEHLVLSFPIGKAPDKTKVDGVKFERDLESELQGKQFCLKGSGWPGQDAKRKTQMTSNNKAAGKRTKDSWGDAKMAIPNYKGQETGTWEEAANIASKDKE